MDAFLFYIIALNVVSWAGD